MGTTNSTPEASVQRPAPSLVELEVKTPNGNGHHSREPSRPELRSLPAVSPRAKAAEDAETVKQEALAGSKIQQLRYWVQQGVEDKIRELHQAGVDVNTPDLGPTVEAELELKAAGKTLPESNGKDKSPTGQVSCEKLTGNYPLHLAAESDCPSVISQLFYFGAKMENKNRIGSTALHRAVSQGHKACVVELINLGANIHAVNTIGNTCLHIAVLTCNVEMIQLLLQNGADKDLRSQNKVFLTPIEYSVKNSPERTLLLNVDPSLAEFLEDADTDFKDIEDEDVKED